jgi:hypothetical protein
MKRYLPVLIAILLLSSFKEKQITCVASGDSITYLNDHLDEHREVTNDCHSKELNSFVEIYLLINLKRIL